jgi:hypothetical protein
LALNDSQLESRFPSTDFFLTNPRTCARTNKGARKTKGSVKEKLRRIPAKSPPAIDASPPKSPAQTKKININIRKVLQNNAQSDGR